MSSIEYDITISQVNQIIGALSEENREKIPQSVRRFFSKYDTYNEEYLLDLDKSFFEQNISEVTKSVLKYIYAYIKK